MPRLQRKNFDAPERVYRITADDRHHFCVPSFLKKLFPNRRVFTRDQMALAQGHSWFMGHPQPRKYPSEQFANAWHDRCLSEQARSRMIGGYMAKYLLIESRDPFESNDVAYYYNLAAGLAKDGNEVTLFLVQNGVLPARKSPGSDGLASVAATGVRILADEFSLRERGIGVERLLKDVTASSLEVVIDSLGKGDRTLWH